MARKPNPRACKHCGGTFLGWTSQKFCSDACAILGNVTPDGECWLWQGVPHENGYGQFNRNGQKLKAHRVAYETFVADIPEGKIACHSCHNRMCANPFHIYPGTHQDNVDDMLRAGRQRRGPKAQLSESDTMAVAKSTAPAKRVAEEYGISISHVWRLRRQRRSTCADMESAERSPS